MTFIWPTQCVHISIWYTISYPVVREKAHIFYSLLLYLQIKTIKSDDIIYLARSRWKVYYDFVSFMVSLYPILNYSTLYSSRTISTTDAYLYVCFSKIWANFPSRATPTCRYPQRELANNIWARPFPNNRYSERFFWRIQRAWYILWMTETSPLNLSEKNKITVTPSNYR